MAKAKKKTVRRGFDFEIPMYEKLLEDAASQSRTFPAHVMRILEDHLTEVEKNVR